MHEVSINQKVFKLTDEQLAKLNAILDGAQVRKSYSQDFIKNTEKINTVSVTRWSGDKE